MTRRRTLLFVVVPVVLAASCLLPFTLFVTRPFAPPSPCIVEIRSKATLADSARRLEQAGAIRSALGFRLLATLRGDNGLIRAGEYEFTRPATPGAVLDRLVAGDVRRVRLTIPEGWTIREISTRTAALGLGSADAFLELAFDRRFIASLGIQSASLEGYLFPETYLLPAKASPEKVIRTMVSEFRRRLGNDLVVAANRRGLNPHQLVTLASIIQKEAGRTSEMPLIAAVFHNRLKRRMPLQADPTVIYGIKDFDGNLRKRDLLAATPYNTYRITGLPPGPIANPGEDALRAAAFPAATDDLYFVARGDGTHAFSRTLEEHNRAVRRFQLKH